MKNTENAAISTAAEQLTMTENQKEDTTMENTTAVSIIDFVTPESLTALHSTMMTKAKTFFGMDKTKVTAAALAAAGEAMDTAKNNYNNGVKLAAYAAALASDSPIAYICKARKYTTMSPINNKTSGVTTRSRSTRFDLFDFIKYANEQKKPIVNAAELQNLLKAVVAPLSTYIDESIKGVENPVTKHTAAALEAICRFVGVPGVHGRAADVRFMGFAVTKVKDLGKLDEVTADALVPFLMDMYHVQLLGKDYEMMKKEVAAEAANA